MRILIATLVVIMPVITAAYMLSLLVPAAAQSPDTFSLTMPLRLSIPKTVKMKDSNGETIATATTSGGGIFYLRDPNGELMGTLVLKPDRTGTFYDPDGKIAKMPTAASDLKPE